MNVKVRRFIATILIAAVGATLAHAQSFTSAPLPDLSQYATTSQLPAHCPTTPSPDTLTGSVSGGNCFTSATDTRPTVVQAAVVTTNGSGTWSVTWAKAFNGASPFINAQPINPAGSQPFICNVASSTSTVVSGQCWQTQTMTLPGIALSLLNLVLNPTGAAPSISVRVAGRDTTQ